MGVAVSLSSRGSSTPVVNFSDHCSRCSAWSDSDLEPRWILGKAEFEGIDCSHLGEEWTKFPPIPNFGAAADSWGNKQG